MNENSAAARLAGLSSAEAARRLAQHGANEVAEKPVPAWLAFLSRFWAPVPWMLEVTVVLQLALGKTDEAAVIALLLVFNAALAFFHERRADRALALLRSRLSIQSRALRDGRWQMVAARELVPGDFVHLRMGDFVPADVELADGDISIDQSALTGESLPVDAGAGATAFAGTVVRRGEANGLVVATGASTRFGKTAELVRSARGVSHLGRLVFAIVRALVLFDLALVALLFVYALFASLPLAELLPFALMLLVASVPVALPATFTLAAALASTGVAARGVLVTRLSALEDAAGMDVLASDKTGTLTENRLRVVDLHPYAPHTEASLLRFAALASDEASQDAIDLAVLAAARERGVQTDGERLKFVPFDPTTRRAEAWVREGEATLRVAKGAPRALIRVAGAPPEVAQEADDLAARGFRIIAVAAGEEDALRLVGLLALRDPPRADSKQVVGRLRDLGVRVLMVTGDNAETARHVAAEVGIGKRVCPREVLAQTPTRECDVIARAYPEDKFQLIQTMQAEGSVVGMTGDGVNDAPALKQAEVGVAVAEATDVAKAAASVVLTRPGLSGVLDGVVAGREVYQRMLTYTLNKIVKTLHISVFLALGVLAAGVLVLRPALVVLLLFTNDFITMSISTDHVECPRTPQRWRIRPLMLASGVLAGALLVFSFAALFYARNVLHLPLPELQTLTFLMLVFTGQGMVYLVRERGYFWRFGPSRWMLIATAGDIAFVTALAIGGILMAPVPANLIGGLAGAVVVFLLLLDFLKVRAFRMIGLT
ncbi:MAG TPA: plasma-membrane proton-efflux P-type ATPase [Burkholderiales bacterium]|nr:plasma-membrane proton-efflux P-type ATPase [Burkholderiales bacterium]